MYDNRKKKGKSIIRADKCVYVENLTKFLIYELKVLVGFLNFRKISSTS